MLTLSSIAPISPQIAVCDSDSQMIDLWLSGKSANTQQAYRRDIDLFLAFIEGKPLQRVTLNDFQAYRQAIESQGWAESSVRRRLNAVKSLITFGHTIGVLAVNAAKPERIGKGKEKISQRILPESAILKMLHSYQGKQRDRAILKFLYASGCRCSEAIGLKWEDCQELDSSNARITLHGKGSKTRVILLNAEVWQEVKALRSDRTLNDAVFCSSRGNALSRTQIHRVVKDAAKQAGIDKPVSAHWLRHAHASHSLKRGAPINLVSQTLGHASLDTTSIYLHADPDDSSGLYLAL